MPNYSPSEVSELLGLNLSSVYRLLKMGHLTVAQKRPLRLTAESVWLAAEGQLSGRYKPRAKRGRK